MNKILLPTDYSEVSVKAIDYASKLFGDYGCEFNVVHSFLLSRSGLSRLRKRYKDTKDFRKSEAAAKDEMRKLLRSLLESHKNDPHVYRAYVTAQRIPDSIKQSVLELQCDMVVMATTGASGLKEVFLGSNAVKVIKKIDFCPLLLVPAGYEYVPVKKILFVNDFRRNFEIEELTPLRAMARVTGAKVVLLYVNDGEPFTPIQEGNRVKLLEMFSGIEVEEQQMPMDNFLTDIIEEYSENHGVNMLAMIRNKHHPVYRLLREPVVKRIAFSSAIPFLVMPEVV
ncbi:universal stress protein [Robertkochia marina]|uniref:Universal stress protein n=1 Tax=Robertkochia marina TaxID=1227945 RepID=A0A4S3M6H8_9FLAO|nr:universal stress protein [Robertkochia marina]THD69837.1 universal stress protein [Robertkochia marina]TRZ46818.1 universal stress protein [Robertkochia marina]